MTENNEADTKEQETPQQQARQQAQPDTSGHYDGSTNTPTFTQDEVDKILSERLARERKKYTEEIAKKEAEARQQMELSKLEGIEKLKKEAELERERLAKERDEYRTELRLANARAALSAVGLSAEFAETVVGEDDEATKRRISELSKHIEAQVSAKIKESLNRGAPPKAGGVEPSSPYDEIVRKSMGLKK